MKKKFWTRKETDYIYSLFNPNYTIQSNAYHIHIILQKQEKYKNIPFNKVYNGVYRAVLRNREKLKKKELQKRKETKEYPINKHNHILLLDIYSKIQNNPEKWYSCFDIWILISKHNRWHLSDAYNEQIKKLNNLLIDMGFKTKKLAFGNMYCICPKRFRDKLVEYKILNLTSEEIEKVEKSKENTLNEFPKEFLFRNLISVKITSNPSRIQIVNKKGEIFNIKLDNQNVYAEDEDTLQRIQKYISKPTPKNRKYIQLIKE